MKGHIEKRVGKSGKVTWTVVIDVPADPVTGKRRQRRLSAPTKKELERLVAKWSLLESLVGLGADR